jgi:hypothetical protein
MEPLAKPALDLKTDRFRTEARLFAATAAISFRSELSEKSGFSQSSELSILPLSIPRTRMRLYFQSGLSRPENGEHSLQSLPESRQLSR